jgi:excisionase family DNA binding protein
MTTLMTRREAATELSVSLSTIDRLVREGRLPIVKASARRRMIRRESLTRYVDRCESFAGEKRRKARVADSGAGVRP